MIFCSLVIIGVLHKTPRPGAPHPRPLRARPRLTLRLYDTKCPIKFQLIQLKQEYPKIKALARREKAEIYAAHMRSDHHAGRTWGRRGETPVVQATGARYGMSLI